MTLPNDAIVGFLGYGNMGSAIAKGLIARRACSPSSIVACDVDTTKTDAARAAGMLVAVSPEDLARRSSILVLAPKPQDMATALESIRSAFSPKTLVISVAAGISTTYIQSLLGANARVARAMPNTPAFVGAGAAGLALSQSCTPADEATARTIFEAVGIVECVPESALDAVTGLSGSGPAYFFYLVECLVKAAVAEGMAPDAATKLAIQTAYGAGKLLHESGESASVLRDRVTSKGGTTYAALETFRARGFEDIVAAAVHAATARSKELGR